MIDASYPIILSPNPHLILDLERLVKQYILEQARYYHYYIIIIIVIIVIIIIIFIIIIIIIVVVIIIYN